MYNTSTHVHVCNTPVLQRALLSNPLTHSPLRSVNLHSLRHSLFRHARLFLRHTRLLLRQARLLLRRRSNSEPRVRSLPCRRRAPRLPRPPRVPPTHRVAAGSIQVAQSAVSVSSNVSLAAQSATQLSRRASPSHSRPSRRVGEEEDAGQASCVWASQRKGTTDSMAVSPAFGRSVGMSIDRPARRRRTVRERERRREGIEAGKYALMDARRSRGGAGRSGWGGLGRG